MSSKIIIIYYKEIVFSHPVTCKLFYLGRETKIIVLLLLIKEDGSHDNFKEAKGLKVFPYLIYLICRKYCKDVNKVVIFHFFLHVIYSE